MIPSLEDPRRKTSRFRNCKHADLSALRQGVLYLRSCLSCLYSLSERDEDGEECI